MPGPAYVRSIIVNVTAINTGVQQWDFNYSLTGVGASNLIIVDAFNFSGSTKADLSCFDNVAGAYNATVGFIGNPTIAASFTRFYLTGAASGTHNITVRQNGTSAADTVRFVITEYSGVLSYYSGSGLSQDLPGLGANVIFAGNFSSLSGHILIGTTLYYNPNTSPPTNPNGGNGTIRFTSDSVWFTLAGVCISDRISSGGSGSVNFTDSVQGDQQYYLTIATAFTPATQTYNVSLGETFSSGDSVGGVATFPGTVGESTPPSDQVSVHETYLGGLSELLGGRNLLLQTNAWGAPWFANDCAIAAGQADPAGGTTGALVTAVASPTNTFIGQSGSTQLANTTKTYSAYIKAGTFVLEQYFMWMRDGAENNIAYSIFDIANGVVNSVFLGTAVITPLPNGWYRCSITGIYPGNAVAGWRIYLDPGSTPAPNETYRTAWHQFEDGGVATAYAANGASPSSGLETLSGQATDAGTLTEAMSAAATHNATFADVGLIQESGALASTQTAVVTDVGAVQEAFAGVDTVAATGQEGVSISEAGALASTQNIALAGFITESSPVFDAMTFFPAFLRSIPEAFVGADTVGGNLGGALLLQETGAAVDTVTGPLTVIGPVVESAPPSDTVGATGSEAVSISEAGSAVDTVAHGFSYPMDVVDAAAGADIVVGNRATTDSILEAGALADTPFGSIGAFLSEAMTGSDDVEVQYTAERDMGEAMPASDFLDVLQGYNVAEAFAGIDTVAATGTGAVSVLEGASLNALADGGLITPGSLVESSSPLDTVLGSFTPVVNIPEAMNAQDTTSVLASDVGILVETGAMADTATAFSSINVAFLERMQAQDQVVFVMWALDLAEALALVEIVNGSPIYPRDVFDSIPIVSDTVGAQTTVPVVFLENMVASDSLNQAWTALCDIAESGQAADLLSVLGVFGGQLIEPMQAVDIPVGTLATLVSLAEQSVVIDTVSGVSVRFIYGNNRVWLPPPLF